MSMTQTQQHNVPALRFPEFSGQWEIKRLEDVADFQNGKAHEQSISSDGDYVVVNSKFISTEGRVRKFTDIQISPLFVDDIVMVMSDIPKGKALAKCYLVDDDDLFSLNQRICSLRARNVDPFYLFLVTNRNDYFLKFDSGVTQTNLRKDEVLRCPAYYPTLPEQQKTASFLSSVDGKIEQLGKKKALLEQYKKGMMQKLFSQELRFKDAQGNDFPDWEETRLGEVLTIGSGRDYKHLGKGDIPVYGTGGFMTSVDEYLYDGESVGIGRKGTIDKPVYLTGKFWTVDTLFFTHSFKSAVPKFIYAVFQSINWKKHNEASGVPSLSKTTIEKIKISMPSTDEQQKIADFLSSIDRKIDLVTSELNHAKTFKKGLLQQMFI